MPLRCREFAGMIEICEHPHQTIQFLRRLVEANCERIGEDPVEKTSADRRTGNDQSSLGRFHAVIAPSPAPLRETRFRWPSRPQYSRSGSAYLVADVDCLVEELEAEVESLLHDVVA